MAEERSGGNRGGYRGNGGHQGGRPGGRGGKGFRPRQGGGHGGYRHSDGEGRGGYHKGGFHKDGYRKDRDFHRDHKDGDSEERREFHRGPRRDGDRREGGDRRDFHRGPRRDGERREGGFHKGPRRDGDRRDGQRRDGGHGNPRYRHDGQHERRNERHERYEQRGERREERGERREFTPEEKRQYRETKRGEYMARPRRNSDGTMSFPSQNPYTARRPDEPKMPKGLDWSMLSKDEKERLRGLAKEHAENIGLHILAAYTLIDDDPKGALEHAKWAARQASRIDFSRETLAFVAYRMGDYKLASREFRTAYRMNGYPDYLPFIADCERGMGQPKKAIEVAVSDDAKLLRGDAKAEMFLVYAGALGDLERWDKAIEIVHTLGRSKGISGGYRMRALQAEQLFLEEAGRGEDAAALDAAIERLEDQYADFELDEESDDVVIDHDLASIMDDEDELAELGITPEDAQYAPEDEIDDESDADIESAPLSDEAVTVDVNGEDTETIGEETQTGDETELTAETAQEGAESETDPADPQADAAADASDNVEAAE